MGFEFWKDLVTGTMAAVGAVLGVVNAWKAFVSDRIKLRVKLVKSYPMSMPSMPDRMIGVEVINLSKFAVTIVDAGLTVAGSSDRLSFAVNPIIADGGPWPRRLESREAVTLRVDAQQLKHQPRPQFVYATTACGETVMTDPAIIRLWTEQRIGSMPWPSVPTLRTSSSQRLSAEPSAASSMPNWTKTNAPKCRSSYPTH